MTRLNYILLMLGLFWLPLVVVAQTPNVQIKDVWTEDDVRYNDKMCLAIHSHIIVDQNKNKNIDVGVLFKDINGNFLKDINNKYCDSEGNVWVTGSGKCSYYSTEWKDFVLYIPYSEIHCPKGKNFLKAVVYVKAQGKWYKSSIIPTTVIFESSTKKRCDLCGATGYRTCWKCRGTGMAQQLMQRPFPPYNSYYVYGQCDVCKGKKQLVCGVCSGTGINSASSTYNSPTSTPVVNNTPYHSGSTYKKEEPKTRTVTCSYCNGTGLELRSISCPVRAFHDCVNIYCRQCGKSHCSSNTVHVNCHSCGGTGSKTQTYYDGIWY